MEYKINVAFISHRGNIKDHLPNKAEDVPSLMKQI